MAAAVFELAGEDNLTGRITQRNGRSGLASGTFDPETGTLIVAGLGYRLGGTVSGTTLAGSGSFETANGVLSVGIVGVMGSTTATETWAGTARSNEGQNCGNPRQSVSQFQFVLESAPTGYVVTGQAVNDTDATQATFKGAATLGSGGGGSGSMTLVMDPPASYATAAGTLSGGSWSGTYRGGDPSHCEQGTWTATRIP